jgi:hypothetical protein
VDTGAVWFVLQKYSHPVTAKVRVYEGVFIIRHFQIKQVVLVIKNILTGLKILEHFVTSNIFTDISTFSFIVAEKEFYREHPEAPFSYN